MLRLLAARPASGDARAVPRRGLGYTLSDHEDVDTHIAKLRGKIEPDPTDRGGSPRCTASGTRLDLRP